MRSASLRRLTGWEARVQRLNRLPKGGSEGLSQRGTSGRILDQEEGSIHPARPQHPIPPLVLIASCSL
jgi:hypothetical protein